jgi:hypothetical protein
MTERSTHAIWPGGVHGSDVHIEGMRQVVLAVCLLSLLAAALWFAVDTWTSIEGPPMPTFGWVALGGGVALSLIVGCGLMALLFYSHRHGYDEIDDRSRR